jgi:hypothetical protein
MSDAWRLVLFGAVASALALRLWGITFGLPYDLTADEPHQIVQALKIGVGEGGPLVRMWHTIGKSGLDYLLFGEYSIMFVVWWLLGRVDGPRAFALQYLTDPTAFYLVGRVTVALLGALTSMAVFFAGKRMYDVRTGLGAAVIAAVAYSHIAASHVINVHVPMAFALWTGVAAYCAYEASGRRRTLVIAGLLCGAAVALSYSAAIGLAMLLVARLSRRSDPWADRAKDAVVLGGASLVSIALMSPDLLTGAGLLIRNFTATRLAVPNGADVRGAIDAVTILRQPDRDGFVQLLLKPDTLVMTIAAVLGVIAGVPRRERWTMLLSGTTAAALVALSASNRGLSEMYLFPVLPAMWLLSSRGVAALSLGGMPLRAAGVAAIAAMPLFLAVRENIMLSKPDTRILAKRWIEANIPSGATILMDGMRFRFVPGVPLNADRATLARRLADLENSELALSGQMLSLYREAAEQADGPAYNLHSTVYGLEVEHLDLYVRSCVPYVVVSSFNEKRYQTDAASRLHPKSARFYRDIKTDSRFQVVYAVGPVMWQQLGPTITVYKVICERTRADAGQASS